MIRKTTFFLTILLCYFLTVVSAEAVTIDIVNYPLTINSLDPVDLSMTLAGAVDATNYLRIDLYKDGTNNYFGETHNGLDWYSGSDGKSYFPIQVQDSSASAVLKFRIGVPNINDYPGPGNYKLRVRRYTASGSQSTGDVQTPVDIMITYASPSPLPTTTATPQPTVQPTPTPTPSLQPTPTKTPTSTPASIKTSIPSLPPPTPLLSTDIPRVASALPSMMVFGATLVPSSQVLAASTSDSKIQNFLPLFLIGFGFMFMISPLVAIMIKNRAKYSSDNDQKDNFPG